MSYDDELFPGMIQFANTTIDKRYCDACQGVSALPGAPEEGRFVNYTDKEGEHRHYVSTGVTIAGKKR